MCLFHGKQKRIVFMKQNCVEAISSDYMRFVHEIFNEVFLVVFAKIVSKNW